MGDSSERFSPRQWFRFRFLRHDVRVRVGIGIGIGVGIGVLAQPQLVVRFMTVKSDKELNRSVLIGGIFIAIMPTTAYITGALSNVYFFDELGKIAVDVVGNNIDRIIPVFINMALPEWFVYLFLLSLVAAAMSTISSQLHTQGTAFGIDICDSIVKKSKKIIDEITITRIGILIAIRISKAAASAIATSLVRFFIVGTITKVIIT